MKPLKTKQDLLDVMKEHWACEEATAWVQSQRAKKAKTIWRNCRNLSWLSWLAERKDWSLAEQWRDYIHKAAPYTYDADANRKDDEKRRQLWIKAW